RVSAGPRNPSPLGRSAPQPAFRSHSFTFAFICGSRFSTLRRHTGLSFRRRRDRPRPFRMTNEECRMTKSRNLLNVSYKEGWRRNGSAEKVLKSIKTRLPLLLTLLIAPPAMPPHGPPAAPFTVDSTSQGPMNGFELFGSGLYWWNHGNYANEV